MLNEHSVCVLALALCLFVGIASAQEKTDNINGEYSIKQNRQYAVKHAVTWGQNGSPTFSNLITLSSSTAVYNCTNTDSYQCEDTNGWTFDWNKLWGKGRCGYYHDHHKDSDRFVWRRCSDASCKAYDGVNNKIQIAGYSYDNSLKPYQHPELLPIFNTTIFPNIQYSYTLVQQSNGISSFTLKGRDSTGDIDETVTVQHQNKCNDYEKGTVQGFYFGGTCRAPIEVTATYES
jgi:hypothetical protein